MPTQRAIEIANAFTKYAKAGDKSIIKQFTREEIETTLLQYHLDRGWVHYVAMEKRIEELKEGQGSNKKTGENWYKKTEIQAALIGGLFLLLAAFISAPHWWPWFEKENPNFIERKSNPQLTNEKIALEQLSNDQLSLVKEIWKYQKENGLNKVIINRDGVIFDEIRNEPTTIYLTSKVSSIPKRDRFRFEQLLLSIPTFFLKQIPETRWGAPYVVTISEEVRELLNK